MRIQAKRSFSNSEITFKKGQMGDVSTEVGRSLVRTGFAIEVKEKKRKPRKRKTADSKKVVETR